MLNATTKTYIYKAVKLLPVKLRQRMARLLENIENSYEPALELQVNKHINNAILNASRGDYETAERELTDALTIAPNNNTLIAPHLGRVRFLKLRSTDASAKIDTQGMLATINSMNEEIASKPIYLAGKFWETFGRLHLQFLEKYGVENFKRTISHHYQNWFMCFLDDAQYVQLIKLLPTHLSVDPWLNHIEILDHVGFHGTANYDDAFQNPTYPLASRKESEIYKVAVGLLWEYVKATDTFGITNQLAESEVGNPIRIWRKGKLISSDLAHSIRERNIFLKALSLSGNEGLVIGELGAGSGRLVEVFGRTTNYRHFIFDITPALFVSQWYIKTLFPNEKIFEFRHFDDFNEICDELQDCRFAFFTSNQIEKLPDDYINLFINLNSLAEMRSEQIKNFLNQIDRLTTSAFLSRQQINSINPMELIPLTKADFAMHERWKLILDTEDEIYPMFFNQIWKR